MEGTRRAHWLPAAESEQTPTARENLVERFLKVRRVLGDVAPNLLKVLLTVRSE
jgi:hypothetical protein